MESPQVSVLSALLELLECEEWPESDDLDSAETSRLAGILTVFLRDERGRNDFVALEDLLSSLQWNGSQFPSQEEWHALPGEVRRALGTAEVSRELGEIKLRETVKFQRHPSSTSTQTGTGVDAPTQTGVDAPLSYKYQTEHVLNFHDTLIRHSGYKASPNQEVMRVMTESFYDVGRQREFATLEALRKEPVDHAHREVILVDIGADKKLKRFLEERVEPEVRAISDVSKKFQRMSSFVAERLDGNGHGEGVTPVPRDSSEYCEAIMEKTNEEICTIRQETESNVIQLGDLKYGVCRHRAILFKLCCDYVGGIECKLVRGEILISDNMPGTSAHAWNEVKVSGRTLICDVLDAPGTLWDPARISKQVFFKKDDSSNTYRRRLAEEETYVPQWHICARDVVQEPNISLGRGGYGRVSRARYKERVVAYKEPNGTWDVEIWKSEISSMYKLRHGNIVILEGASIAPPFMIMEYMAGGSLQSAYRGLEFATENRRLEVLLDVAKGLQYLHSQSPPMVHRDLTPANILLSDRGAAKITDFGISRENAGSNGMTVQNVRNTGYVAPEGSYELGPQRRSTEKLDIYSFGVTAWELCAQRPPDKSPVHNGETWVHITPSVEVLDSATVSKGLNSFIKRCLDCSPQRRPTAEQLVRFLENSIGKGSTDGVQIPEGDGDDSISHEPPEGGQTTMISTQAGVSQLVNFIDFTALESRTQEQVPELAPPQEGEASKPVNIPLSFLTKTLPIKIRHGDLEEWNLAEPTMSNRDTQVLEGVVSEICVEYRYHSQTVAPERVHFILDELKKHHFGGVLLKYTTTDNLRTGESSLKLHMWFSAVTYENLASRVNHNAMPLLIYSSKDRLQYRVSECKLVYGSATIIPSLIPAAILKKQEKRKGDLLAVLREDYEMEIHPDITSISTIPANMRDTWPSEGIFQSMRSWYEQHLSPTKDESQSEQPTGFLRVLGGFLGIR
ncbi:hypothetical protein CYMTET_6535 [Cymbomonas tetramitiformis]|uniref:Protein kinase domain-containing protein n=1 Tax=Cymbomonas tetramitiformis TaxID=36881 RepID=A0AAE0LIB2_9CHLO|nr:hypothetical protein CYMTET_6535 [Cymbomonas tetramitiformis]